MSTEDTVRGIVLKALRVEVSGRMSCGPVPGTPEFDEEQRAKAEATRDSAPVTLRAADTPEG